MPGSAQADEGQNEFDDGRYQGGTSFPRPSYVLPGLVQHLEHVAATSRQVGKVRFRDAHLT